MKKLLLLPLLLFTPLFALPIGNPMDASLYTNGLFWNDCYDDHCCDPCDPCFDWCDSWSIRLGFYGDYVFNRHMELKNRGNGDLDSFELYTNAGLINLNICDRFDAFATFGGTNFALATNPAVFGSLNVVSSNQISRFYLSTDTDFSWSVGGRFTVWSCDCFYFGIEGQYFYTKPDVAVFYQSGLNTYTNPDDSTALEYKEWQVGIGASYLMRVGCSGISAIPYIGIKWAGSTADFGNAVFVDTISPIVASETVTLFTLQNQKLMGYSVGVTLLFCDAISFTAEGRWGDERALHVNGQFRF